jgi:hypothetical protein
MDGKNQQDMEKAILRNDLQVDLLKKFSQGLSAMKGILFILCRRLILLKLIILSI